MGQKTIEKITHKSTPKGLRDRLYVKWTEGRELLRNSARFQGKESWDSVSTVGTRVVFDTDWAEYGVYVYINKLRFYQLDIYRSDKSEALEAAKSLRLCSDWTIRQAAKSSPKGKKTATKTKSSPKGKKTTAKKTSPKGKKTATKSSPKVKTVAKKTAARRARKAKSTVATKN